MCIFDALCNVFLRLFLAFFAGAAAIVVAMVSGALSGGGQDGVFIATMIVFAGAGWALLPAVRASRTLGILVAIAWIGLAVSLSLFDASQLFGPWFLATFGVCLLMWHQPPEYLQRFFDVGEQNDDKDGGG